MEAFLECLKSRVIVRKGIGETIFKMRYAGDEVVQETSFGESFRPLRRRILDGANQEEGMKVWGKVTLFLSILGFAIFLGYILVQLIWFR